MLMLGGIMKDQMMCRILSTIILAVMLALAFTAVSDGYELSIGYGTIIPKTEGLDGYVYQVEVAEQLRGPWFGSIVLDALQGNVHHPSVDGASADAIAISSRVSLHKQFGNISSAVFGGFGFVSNQLPEFGDSGVVAHFGARLNISVSILDIGLEVWHMSDPLRHGDAGWEMALMTMRIPF